MKTYRGPLKFQDWIGICIHFIKEYSGPNQSGEKSWSDKHIIFCIFTKSERIFLTSYPKGP